LNIEDTKKFGEGGFRPSAKHVKRKERSDVKLSTGRGKETSKGTNVPSG